MMLTFLGGVLGVLLAVGISRCFLIPSMPASIPMWAVISGFTVCRCRIYLWSLAGA